MAGVSPRADDDQPALRPHNDPARVGADVCGVVRDDDTRHGEVELGALPGPGCPGAPVTQRLVRTVQLQPHLAPPSAHCGVLAVGGYKPEAAGHQEVSPVLTGQHPRHSEGEEDHVGGGGDESVVHHTTVTLLVTLLLPLHLRDEDPRHPPPPLPHLTAVLTQGTVQHSLARPSLHADVGELDLNSLVGRADHLDPAGDVLPAPPAIQEDVPG